VTESISAKEHNINNREKNSSIYKDSPPPNLVNFGPQTAKNDGRVSAHPVKFVRTTSCRLTSARHFGLIIFGSTHISRAWLALVRLRDGRAHAGFAMYLVQCIVLGSKIVLLQYSSMIVDPIPKEIIIYLKKRYWTGNLAAKPASR